MKPIFSSRNTPSRLGRSRASIAMNAVRLYVWRICLVAGVALLTACATENDSGPDDGAPPSRGWEMVWNDEFDGSELNLENWDIQIGDGLAEGIPNGWGNNESQYYTENNITVSDGNLTITALADSPTPDPDFGDDPSYTYSSARIRTQGKFDFTFGRIEARIKTPAVQGVWPAFWLLGSDSGPYGGWAARGEIDIMEVYKIGVDDLGDAADPADDIFYDPTMSAAAHYGGPFPFNVFTSRSFDTDPETGMPFDPTDGFHIYAVEWDAERIRWFVDGVNYFSLRHENYWNYFYTGEEFGYGQGGPSAPFDADHHIILNMAVGGNLPLQPPNPEPPIPGNFPAEMVVDYVRVYQCPFDTVTGVGCANQMDEAFEYLEYEEPTDNGIFQFVPLYSEGPVTLPSGRELSLVEDDPAGVLSLELVKVEGDALDTLQVISTGTGGRFSIRDQDDQELTLSGLGTAVDDNDPSNDFITLADFKMTLNIDSAATDPDATLRLFMTTDTAESWIDFPFASLPQDEWILRSFGIDRILNTDPATSSGDLFDPASTIDWLGFEVLGNASFRLGEFVFACGGPSFCGLVDKFDIYVNSVIPLWDRGILGFDTDVGTDYSERIGNHVEWIQRDTGEVGYDTVIETQFGNTGASAVTFIGATDDNAVDMTALEGGELVFDLRMISNPNDVDMYFKVEHGPGEGTGEIPVGDTPLGTWVQTCIPVNYLKFRGLQTDRVTAPFVLVPGEGGAGQGVIVQWDNVVFSPEITCATSLVPPIDFEADTLFPIGSFEGAFTQVIDNPQVSGINLSSRVAEMVKNIPPDPSKPFGGSFIALSDAIDFSQGSAFKMKTFANRAGMNILFKLESTETTASASAALTTTTANQWEELTFDLTGQEAENLNRLTIIIDEFTAGDGSADFTLLFDDIIQTESSLQPVQLPVTFDNPSVSYVLTDFEGANSSIEADPLGVNGNVAASFFPAGLKSPNALTILGGSNGFTDPIPFVGTDVVISVDVNAPRTGVKVQLKIENANNQFTSGFDEQFTTTSGGWETLTFTIDNLVSTDTFEKLILFFDQGQFFTAADETWYWDNIRVEIP